MLRYLRKIMLISVAVFCGLPAWAVYVCVHRNQCVDSKGIPNQIVTVKCSSYLCSGTAVAVMTCNGIVVSTTLNTAGMTCSTADDATRTYTYPCVAGGVLTTCNGNINFNLGCSNRNHPYLCGSVMCDNWYCDCTVCW